MLPDVLSGECVSIIIQIPENTGISHICFLPWITGGRRNVQSERVMGVNTCRDFLYAGEVQIKNLLLDALEAILKDKPSDVIQYTADFFQFGLQAAQQVCFSSTYSWRKVHASVFWTWSFMALEIPSWAKILLDKACSTKQRKVLVQMYMNVFGFWMEHSLSPPRGTAGPVQYENHGGLDANHSNMVVEEASVLGIWWYHDTQVMCGM